MSTNPYETSESKQIELLEGGTAMKNHPAKRVNIVSLKLVGESSLLYKNRHIRSQRDSYDLIPTFIVPIIVAVSTEVVKEIAKEK